MRFECDWNFKKIFSCVYNHENCFESHVTPP